MFDPAARRMPMSPETLATLGENRVAYIKAIRSEDVAFLCAEAPMLERRLPGVRPARRRRHPDHPRRQPRIGDGGRREPRARNRQRALRPRRARLPRSIAAAIVMRVGLDLFENALRCMLRRARRRHRQHGVERLGVARVAQLARDVRIAQQPRHARQRLEMIGAGAFRREQQEDQIDRLAVERLEIDRPLQPRKQPEQLVELRQLAVRNGDAVADAGRAELLALQQDFEDRALALAGELGGLARRAPAAPASCR